MLFLVTYLYIPAKGTTVRDAAVIAAESEQDARNEFHSTAFVPRSFPKKLASSVSEWRQRHPRARPVLLLKGEWEARS